MKINGKSSYKPRFVYFSVDRINDLSEKEVLTFKLSGLPMDFDRTLSKDLPEPVPPITDRVVKDNSGKVMRNEFGAPVLACNEKDPVYVEALEEHRMLGAVAQLYLSLQHDENIQFESKRTDFKTGKEFYQAILKEFSALSLSIGDLYRMVDAMNEASSLKKENLSEARESFL